MDPVSMILANWQNRWFLASRANAGSDSCALVASDLEDLSRIGFKSEQRSFGRPGNSNFSEWRIWHCWRESVNGIVFFPELRFRQAKVYPEYWSFDSSEAVLQCRLMGWDAYSAAYSNEQQIADGWIGVGSGDGATKWIHVDELEKIEGPPPEGPF